MSKVINKIERQYASHKSLVGINISASSGTGFVNRGKNDYNLAPNESKKADDLYMNEMK